MTRLVGKMSDHPMPDQGHGHTQTDTPKNQTDAAKNKERHSDKKLLGHPVTLHPLVDGIMRDLWFNFKIRRIFQIKTAVHLPPCIAQKTRAMAGVGRAFGLALMPVAHVMRPDHSKGACHAHQCTEPDQKVFKPLGCFERLVNQQPVHADRMACANGHGSRRQKDQKACRAGKDKQGRQSPRSHHHQPERFLGIPPDHAV